ncbi:hypothetical protein [Plantibacter sp. YIM 135249]|uniref:hypothetical protein n=1 Tax=Plantibacter sp. YIM 135249 TaxID=3423918 RepID=UPI003D3485CD
MRFDLLSTIAIAAVLVGASSAPADASTGVEVTSTAPPGTAAVWVDVEHPDVTPENTRLTMRTVDEALPTTPRPTTFGLTTIVDVGAGELALVIDADASVDADVAFTYVDTAGKVLSARSSRIDIGPGADPAPGSITPGAPDTGTDDERSAAAKSGWLANSGWTLPLALIVAAVIAIALGLVVRARRIGGRA